MPQILSPWPIPRLPNWNWRVNEPLSEKELNAVRTSIDRGRPFGDDEWTEEMAETHGVWFTLRPIGRPRKQKTPNAP
jgi:putative transposase